MNTTPILYSGRYSRTMQARLNRPRANGQDRLASGVSALLLHVVLAMLCLQATGKGLGGYKGGSNSHGDSLVVYPAMLISLEKAAHPTTPAPNPATDITKDLTPTRQTAESSISSPVIMPPRPITPIESNTKANAPINRTSQTANKTAQTTSSSAASTSSSGSSGNDLLASYQAALRSAIYGKWQTLTKRGYPSGCVIHLSQNPGGAVTASSAANCGLSKEDQLQLEASALMAQPLPYAGYESVFKGEMDLIL